MYPVRVGMDRAHLRALRPLPVIIVAVKKQILNIKCKMNIMNLEMIIKNEFEKLAVRLSDLESNTQISLHPGIEYLQQQLHRVKISSLSRSIFDSNIEHPWFLARIDQFSVFRLI